MSDYAKQPLLDGYLTEVEMARERNIALRTLRAERARGDGPPYIKTLNKVYYSQESFLTWFKAQEKTPPRSRITPRKKASGEEART